MNCTNSQNKSIASLFMAETYNLKNM